MRNYLHSLEIEARIITLIEHRNKFRWIIQGSYQSRDKAIFTLDFHAYQLCLHARSPQGVPACSHSTVCLKCDEYSVKEFGGEIELTKK